MIGRLQFILSLICPFVGLLRPAVKERSPFVIVDTHPACDEGVLHPTGIFYSNPLGHLCNCLIPSDTDQVASYPM